jgi:hypothetical protein
MVARIDGFAGVPEGRLVVLQDEAGQLSELVGSRELMDSWRCLRLGVVEASDGKNPDTVYVPDAHLTPVGHMNADQIAELIHDRAVERVNATVAQLGRILERSGDVEIDDARLERAGEQALLEHALERMATASVLRDARFRPVHAGGSLLRRDFRWEGSSLRIEAGATPLGSWLLASAGAASAKVLGEESMLPGEATRGEVLAEVWRMWRAACPGAPVPAGLEPGALHSQHVRRLQALGVTGTRLP